jgi:hypothetical protein
MTIKLVQPFQILINIPGIKNIVPKWVERISQRRAFQTAMTNAYTVSARRYYPKWSSYFFDEKFRTHGATHLLASYQKNTVWPEPIELANIWADQMLWLREETKQKHIAEMVPVASRFLLCLELELQARPEF